MHDIDLGSVWHDMPPVVEEAHGVVREHAVAFRPENLCPVLHGVTDKTTVAHADRVAEQQYAAFVFNSRLGCISSCQSLRAIVRSNYALAFVGRAWIDEINAQASSVDERFREIAVALVWIVELWNCGNMKLWKYGNESKRHLGTQAFPKEKDLNRLRPIHGKATNPAPPARHAAMDVWRPIP